jgi:fibronectin type 3 domain-containing protein
MKLSLQTLLSTLLLLTLFSGCTRQPEPKQQVVDPTLPVVHINGHISDMNAIAFEWRKVEDPRIAGVHIYRRLADVKGKLVRIATVDSRYVTHYLDANVEPDTRYIYRFTSFNAKGAESPGSESITASTLPLIEPVSFFASIGNMPRSAKLIWRPHPDLRVNSYRIERQSLEVPEWHKIVEVKGRLNAEYIDSDLKDNNVYKYRIRAVTFDKLATEPSKIVRVTTKPLPTPVQNVRATSDLPGRILLSWQAVPSEDFDYYKVYRSETAKGGYDYHVKTRDTSFPDEVKSPGKIYFYKVTAVDKDGLESPLPALPAQGSSLGRPAAPVMTHAAYADRSFRLRWQNSDPRTVSFTLVKTTHHS